jgi:hypothetical protein
MSDIGLGVDNAPLGQRIATLGVCVPWISTEGPMPVYYFNLWDGKKRLPDAEGSELCDLSAAVEEARRAAREIAIEQLRSNEPVDGNKIEVADTAGKVLATVAIKDVLG